jgi:hypothetical protein
VCLCEQATDSRLSIAQYDKQVFNNETVALKLVYELNVGQALLIGANLVLALDYVNTT